MVLKVKAAVMPVNVDKAALLHKVVASVSVLGERRKTARHAKTVLSDSILMNRTGSNAMHVQRARPLSNQKVFTRTTARAKPVLSLSMMPTPADALKA
jgi:hypothetical protein